MTKKPLHIVKIGGNIIDDKAKLTAFLEDFAQIKEDKILVHGGGKIATQLAKKLQLPQQMIEGRRVTDAETLKLITMVYGGLLSKNIVAELAKLKALAIGLSGADVASVTSVRRPAEPIDFGFVGDVVSVNATHITKLVQAGFVPVFCAITHDGNGQLLNTNADTMAKEIAASMSATYDTFLYYCFEKKGVLLDVSDDRSVIAELNPTTYKNLKAAGKIFEGMIPKLDNAFNAIEDGVKQVHILNAKDLLSLVLNQENHGTKLTQ